MLTEVAANEKAEEHLEANLIKAELMVNKLVADEE
jgi:hypothetical protein